MTDCGYQRTPASTHYERSKMVKTWLGYGWAQQPVTSRTWALITSLLSTISRLTGYRVLNRAKHVAWCKAIGQDWRSTTP